MMDIAIRDEAQRLAAAPDPEKDEPPQLAAFVAERVPQKVRRRMRLINILRKGEP